MKKVFSIAFILILIDQISKFYVKLNFEYETGVNMFGFDWAQIKFIENAGMAYGVQLGGETGKIALSIVRFIIITLGIVYAFYWVKKHKPNNYFLIPIALLVAGAIGNLIDSMFYGLIFDKGLVWDENMQQFTQSYSGLAQANFNGYSHFMSGVVVDMFYFPIINIERMPDWIPIWGGKSFLFFSPVFNFADSCITVGVILLLLFKKKAFPANSF